MKLTLTLTAAAALFLVAGCEPGGNTKFAESTETVSLSGTIVAVDQANRLFTVRDGRTTVVYRAGPQVRNFAELQPGDEINFDFYESIAVGLADPDDPGTAVGASVVGRAAPGQRPGGGAMETVSAVVELLSFDPVTNFANVRLPDGGVERVFVPEEMRTFAAARAPGDRIVVAIDRAVAVTVTEVG